VMLSSGCCARAVLFFRFIALFTRLCAGCGVVRCREVWCWRYRRTVDQVGGGILRGAGASTGDVVLAGCVVWPWRRDQRSAREETIC